MNRTLGSVPLVSVLKRFDCIRYSVDIAFHDGDSALLAINVHAVDHHL